MKPVRNLAFTFIEILIAMVIVAVITGFSVPMYKEYVIKNKVNSLVESAFPAQLIVTSDFINKNSLTGIDYANNSTTFTNTTSNPNAQSVDIVDGVITIVGDANELAGNNITITLTPYNSPLEWCCTTSPANFDYVPKHCRNETFSDCLGCSGGQILDGNNCVCPTGANWSGSNCITCTGGQYFDNATLSCLCPAGQQWNNVICSVCRVGEVWNTTTLTCDCLSNYFLDNASSTCKYCFSPGTWTGNDCDCLDDRIWNGTTCECTPAHGTVWNAITSVCECPANYYWSSVSSVCKYCVSPGTWDGNNCRCPDVATWDGTKCVCSGGRIFDTSTNTCKCPTGSNWNNTQCITCQANAAWNQATLSCKCVSNYYLYSSTCKYCPSPGVWDGNSCECTDPNASWHNTLNTCVCGSKTNSTFNLSTLKCECDKDYYRNSGGKYCDYCPAPATWNTSIFQCECPSPGIWDSIDKRCEASGRRLWNQSTNSYTCPSNSTWNSTSGNCECNTNYYWKTNISVCEYCPAPKIWATNEVCISCGTSASAWNGEIIWNGYACVCRPELVPISAVANPPEGCQCPGNTSYSSMNSYGQYVGYYLLPGTLKWDGSSCKCLAGTTITSRLTPYNGYTNVGCSSPSYPTYACYVTLCQ